MVSECEVHRASHEKLNIINKHLEMNMTETGSSNGMVKATLWCAGACIAAMAAAFITWYLMRGQHPIIIAAAADLVATVVVFAFSVMVNNSSIYDPYWSVAPIPIVIYWGLAAQNPEVDVLRQGIVAFLVIAWGYRLTGNWYRHWKGLGHEDWRYVDFRKSTGKAYWLVSFLGIHQFPTVMVFLGCLSLYPAMAAGTSPFGHLDILAILVTGGAILIEATADRQLHMFTAEAGGQKLIMDRGLWRYSRHPNYFGEVAFWWGLFLFGLASGTFYWWTVIGPAAITLMFIFVSIPMMEKRMVERRPGYVERQKRVSALVPWPPKEQV